MFKNGLTSFLYLIIALSVFSGCETNSVHSESTQTTAQYAVTFDADGGTPATQTVIAQANRTVTLPAEPAKNNSVFSGWFTQKNGQGTQFTSTTTVTDNITVYAKWLPSGEVYTVTFNADGGTPATQAKQATSGGTVALPAAPAKGTDTFSGWFTGQNGQGSEFTASTPVNASITVYAYWIPAGAAQYTVTFNADGGTPATQTAQATPGGTVTLPAGPVKSGFTFAGWFTLPGGQGTAFTQTTPVNDNITVYAGWTPVVFTYTVAFDADGGTPATQTKQAVPGSTVSLPDTPARGTDVFMGWYTQRNGLGTHFTSATPVSDNITVYAYWIPVSDIHTVTFDADGGTPASQTKAAINNNMVPLPPNPVKAHNVFSGWFAQKNGQGAQFTSTTRITADITIYAYWIPVPIYTVTFESAGGTPAIYTEETYGNPVPLPTPPVRGNDIFIGWYTGQNGQGVQFTNITLISADMTVYAYWLPESSIFTVTFDADGGSPGSQTKLAINTNMVTLPSDPAKTGYVFSGWYTLKNGQGTQFTSTTQITGDVTVYAYWVPI